MIGPLVMGRFGPQRSGDLDPVLDGAHAARRPSRALGDAALMPSPDLAVQGNRVACPSDLDLLDDATHPMKHLRRGLGGCARDVAADMAGQLDAVGEGLLVFDTETEAVIEQRL